MTPSRVLLFAALLSGSATLALAQPSTSDHAPAPTVAMIYGEAPGAVVLVDGTRRGQMPLNDADALRLELAPGKHTIELKRAANNELYDFTARRDVTVNQEVLVPVMMPPLQPTPLPGAAARITATVDALLADMAKIPAGSFLMGGRDEENSADTEFPRHEVRFTQSFLMLKRNVTFDQWDACIADGGCSEVPGDEGRGRGGREVANVSWHDAEGFAQWLSRRLGRQCRLPSEAEWEYALRAGGQSTYFFGDDAAKIGDYMSRGGSHPSQAVAKRPNAWGLLSMAGGLTEWVGDCWHESYAGAPADGSTWTEDHCQARSVRGGFWDADPWYHRSARRSVMNPRNRYNYVGFRVVCTTAP
jgi:formylglycine-generating enzyme required for sulfatase activity